ncbi:MAG: hypothetical protein GF330_03345 [Candidatus Eisenbacteria bacterium]|nr:hypothetical protein [Candidatus Eisenbacteria bacterium]
MKRDSDRRVARPVAAWLCLLLGLWVHAGAGAETLGRNGGVRLLLHVEPYEMPPGGIQADPCTLLTPLTDVEQIVTEHAAIGDTVRVWAYLYTPREMLVRGVGFAIEYEGIDFIVSGACAPMIGQDPEIMGTWPESGSEIAAVWMPEAPRTGHLAPVAWFVLRALESDAYFGVGPGNSPFSGRVGDDNLPPRENRIWDYGRIGFGTRAGKLPIPDPRTLPSSGGAVEIRMR